MFANSAFEPYSHQGLFYGLVLLAFVAIVVFSKIKLPPKITALTVNGLVVINSVIQARVLVDPYTFMLVFVPLLITYLLTRQHKTGGYSEYLHETKDGKKDRRYKDNPLIEIPIEIIPAKPIAKHCFLSLVILTVLSIISLIIYIIGTVNGGAS